MSLAFLIRWPQVNLLLTVSSPRFSHLERESLHKIPPAQGPGITFTPFRNLDWYIASIYPYSNMFGIRRHVLKSSPLALLSLLLLSGATIMLFFCLLGGVTHHNPLNRVFFLQADTSNIPGAPPLTHFTLNNACDQRNGVNFACRGRKAASPMLPQQLFGTNTGVPQPFLRHPNKYYYLSRFTYAFYIITIFFILLALLLNFLATVSTLATLAAVIMTGVTLLSCTFLACIMTAVYVQAQNAFRGAGRFARVGVKAFAFTWTSLFLIFLSLLTLLALWAYRYKQDRQLKKTTGEKPHRKRDSMMASLLGRRHKIGRGGFDSDKGKRASYDSSFYNQDVHREKDVDRGVAPVPPVSASRDTYTSQPGTAVRRDERGVIRHDHAEDHGGRRFAGHMADDYTTPGARGGHTAYTPGAYVPEARTAPPSTSPVQLNAPR
ncbi:SUR7/PalI family-domain-containing protein [Tirmania nivea]|nr:SUR7/PalI family-domain-containing protein [Tirmania nivea]